MQQNPPMPKEAAPQDLIHKKQSVSSSKHFFDRRNQSNSMKHKSGENGANVP